MLLVDTHVLIEFLRGDVRLSMSVQKLVGESFSQGHLAVSAMSIVEAVRLHEHGKIDLGFSPDDWVSTQVRAGLHVVPVDARIAALAPQLSKKGFHTDPVDQLIAGTAVLTGHLFVTGDRQIISWAKQAGLIEFVDART